MDSIFKILFLISWELFIKNDIEYFSYFLQALQ